MSSSTEKILLQLIELEQKIHETKLLGRDTTLLEEQALILRKEFETLNEVLSNPKTVLKG